MVDVHISYPPDERALEELETRLDKGIHLSTGEPFPKPAIFHILVAGRPTREQLAASHNLHTLIIPFAGIPPETRDLMIDFPEIGVHNLHHNAAATAESALALLMAAAKLTIPFDRKLRANDWRPRYEPNPAVLLEGKTVLILGYGHIGRHAARVCQAMGMKIMATKRHHEADVPDDIGTEVHPPEVLHDLLPLADVILVTLPLTEKTEGLIGERELALLPPNAILVNVGRGAIVNQGALFQALQNGKLHAAGLDVWYNYPADEASRANTSPAKFPFHELENVVMSPHRGGGSRESDFNRMKHLAEALNAAARGDPLPNKVDIQAGY